MAYKNKDDPRNKEAKLRHYYKNKQQYLDNNKKKRETMARFTNAVKSYPCVDCGANYPPYVMQFDHLQQFQKEGTICAIKRNGSWNKLIQEIMKCDLVCSNCHAERTHKRSGVV